MEKNEMKPCGSSREKKARKIFEDGLVLLPPGKSAGELVRMLTLGGNIHVLSQEDPEYRYYVNGKCTCRDYLHHAKKFPKWLCKHRLALKMALTNLMERESRKTRENLEEDLLKALGQEMARWPLTIVWPEPSRLSEDDWVDWRCRKSGEFAFRNEKGQWEFIPVLAQ